MPKFAQFESENPIIRDQPISSREQGYDQLAKIAGVTSQAAFEKATSMAQEASDSNMLQSQGMLNDLETNTKISFAKNPAMAANTAEQARKTAQTLKQSTFLNEADRKKFNYLADRAVDQLKLEGEKTSIELDREHAKFQGLVDYNSNLQGIYDSLFTDPQAAKILMDSMIGSIYGKQKAGIYTAVEAANLVKGLQDEQKRAYERGAGFEKGDASAAQVNAINSYQPNAAPYSNANLPMDGHTRYGAAQHIGNMNHQDMVSSIANGHYISAFDRRNIKGDAEWKYIDSYQYGAMDAEGQIRSADSWNNINHEIKRLSADGANLTVRETGYKKRLQNYKSKIENGGFTEFALNTPDGAKAFLDYQRQTAAIDKTIFPVAPEMQDQFRNQAKSKAENDFWHQINAIGIGSDIPEQYRNPIPAQITNPIKDAFKLGADPNMLVNSLAKIDSTNLPYAANAMPNPRQRLVVYQTGRMMGAVDKGFMSDYIASQQDQGAESSKFMNLNRDKEGMSNAKIKEKVLPSISGINDYLLKQRDGVQLASASADSAVRYIEYVAAKHGDANFKNINNYIDDYKNNVSKAYQIYSHFGGTIDFNTVPVDKQQADALITYVRNEGGNQMKKDMNAAEYDESISRNPLNVISTNTGRLVLIDSYGRTVTRKNGLPAFDRQYSPNMMHAANIHSIDSRNEVGNYIAGNNKNPFLYKSKFIEGRPKKSLKEIVYDNR